MHQLLTKFANPTLTFWLMLILALVFTVTGNHMRKTIRTGNPLEPKQIKKLIRLCTLTITVAGFHHWTLGVQGLETGKVLLRNPYTLTQAAKLAPHASQVTLVEDLNDLSDKEKVETIVVVYKFGCPHCQRFWLYAKEHPELLPSKNVLWIPTTSYNKEKSTLVSDAETYPSIVFWKKQGSKLVEQRIETPTDDQLDMLTNLAKTYAK